MSRDNRSMGEASALLREARCVSRLHLHEIATGLDISPRTFTRWEAGRCRPSKKSWIKLTNFFARYVPDIAVRLAQATNVPSPFPPPVQVDLRSIEHAILGAADLIDVPASRIRLAVRYIAEAVEAAHGTVADLALAAQEKATPTGGSLTLHRTETAPPAAGASFHENSMSSG